MTRTTNPLINSVFSGRPLNTRTLAGKGGDFTYAQLDEPVLLRNIAEPGVENSMGPSNVHHLFPK